MVLPYSKSEYLFIEESKVHALFQRLDKFKFEPEVKSFLRAAAGHIKAQIERNFITGGGKVGGWVPLHWITGALRRQGERGKIRNFSELSSRTHNFVPLNTQPMGTGLGKEITRKVEFGKDYVRVGTTNKLVIDHHKGFIEDFKFTGYYKHVLNKNIARKVGGKANPFYWWIFREMTKIHGTRRKTPPRPIYFILSTEDMRILKDMAEDALTDLLIRRAWAPKWQR
jgi:hypothetical protein